MTPSLWQILLVVFLILVFFGRGKISEFMKELGKGASSFKAGVKEGQEDEKKPVEKKASNSKTKK